MKSIFLKENIGLIRDFKRLTYKELAERIHVTEGQAKSYEIRGSEPRIATLLEIADFAGISLDSLVREKLTNEKLSSPARLRESPEVSSLYKQLADRLSSIKRPLTPSLTLGRKTPSSR